MRIRSTRELPAPEPDSRLDTTQRYLADAEKYIGAIQRHVNTGDGVRLIADYRRNAEPT